MEKSNDNELCPFKNYNEWINKCQEEFIKAKFKKPEYYNWPIVVGRTKFKALQDAGAISKEGEIISIQKCIQVENELSKNK